MRDPVERIQELLETTNHYLERARTAEGVMSGTMEGLSVLPAEVTARYWNMIPTGVETRCIPDPGTDLCHLRWMLQQLRGAMEAAKANRWLGFIQCVLIERGYTTVSAEREFTRAYLARPASPFNERDATNLLSVIADIREKSGVGAKPMLSELADAIAAKIAEADGTKPS